MEEFVSKTLENYGPMGFAIVIFMIVVFLGGGKLIWKIVNFFIAAIDKRDVAMEQMTKDFSCSLKEQNESCARSQKEQVAAIRDQSFNFLQALESHTRLLTERHDILLKGVDDIKKKIGAT